MLAKGEQGVHCEQKGSNASGAEYIKGDQCPGALRTKGERRE